jgi:hypothetical protein
MGRWITRPPAPKPVPPGAITFGDLNNEEHKVHELAKSPSDAFRLLERLGTNTKVYY